MTAGRMDSFRGSTMEGESKSIRRLAASAAAAACHSSPPPTGRRRFFPQRWPGTSTALALLLLAGTHPCHAQSTAPAADLLLDSADASTAWRTSGTNTLTVDSQIKVLG